MKRILAFILAVLSLFSVFAVTASAAESATPSVMTELAGLQVAGKQFQEADYPKDATREDVELLVAVEKNFSTPESSNGYGFYVFLYNPSGKVLDEKNNTIQIGLNYGSTDFSFYGLEFMSRSDDYRFYKFKVSGYGKNVVSELHERQERASERVYNIVALRLSEKNILTSYPVKKIYAFSGYDAFDNLKCSVNGGEVVSVELYDTTWVSPNAGDLGVSVDFGSVSGDEYDHYEIHSVYFAIDKKYMNEYGFKYISSMRASYVPVKLTPILVANPDFFSDEAGQKTISLIENVESVSTYGKDAYNLVSNYKYVWDTDVDTAFNTGDWGYSQTNLAPGWLGASFQGKRYDRLAYYFGNSSLPKDFDFGDANSMLGFTSEQLEKRYYELKNSGIPQEYYCAEVGAPREIKYVSSDFFSLESYTENLKGIAKWWHNLTISKDSYLNAEFADKIKKIEVIENPSKYGAIQPSEYFIKSNELFINECDLPAFSTFCYNAAEKGQVVVLLRFAMSSYRSTIVDSLNDNGKNATHVGFSIDKWAFTDFSMLDIGFSTGAVEIVVPTVSNVVDSFGDGLVYEPVEPNIKLPDPSDWWERIQEWLDSVKKMIMFVLMVLVLVALVIAVIRLLPSLIRTGTAMRESRRQRRRAREEKKKNKNNTRRR